MGARRSAVEIVSGNRDDFGSAYRRFSGKKVFVTGHTGFKGSWLTLWLTELSASVTGYALAPSDRNAHFVELGLTDRICNHAGDIRDLQSLRTAVHDAQPEIVFHLAAQSLVRKSYADPLETFSTNVMGGANLLEAVRDCESVKALVFITSDKCYENKEWVWGYRETDELGGKDPYSASKAATELVFGAYRASYFSARAEFGCATTRAGNVIGGGDRSADRLVPDCIRALEKGEPIVIRNPASTRPWQFVLEPLSGYLDLALALLDYPKAYSGAWNFGPSAEGFLTVEDVAAELVANWGSGSIRKASNAAVAHEAARLQLSIDKAARELHWRPTYSGREAIRATAEWYRRRHEGAPALALSVQQIKNYVAARHAHD
jgi:CDP-glucose 4,6-dehydratase